MKKQMIAVLSVLVMASAAKAGTSSSAAMDRAKDVLASGEGAVYDGSASRADAAVNADIYASAASNLEKTSGMGKKTNLVDAESKVSSPAVSRREHSYDPATDGKRVFVESVIAGVLVGGGIVALGGSLLVGVTIGLLALAVYGVCRSSSMGAQDASSRGAAD